MLGGVGDGLEVGDPGGQGEADGVDGQIPLGHSGGVLGEGVGLAGGQVLPEDDPVPVRGAGHHRAAVSRQGKGDPLQGGVPGPGLDDLEAGGGFVTLGPGPGEGEGGVTGGIAGVRDDEGLLGVVGVIGQIEVILGHTALGLDGQGALLRRAVHRQAELEGSIELDIVGVQVGLPVLAGVHLVIGDAAALFGLQGGVVFRHKDGPLGGVRGVDLGGVAVDPGGGGGGDV